MSQDNAFIGTGWAFPVTFTEEGVQMVSDEQDIEQSLEILLGTRPSERAMNLAFSCDVNDLVFANPTRETLEFMKTLIADAIVEHEPRITLNSLEIEVDPHADGQLAIEIAYTVNQTNSRRNKVYPFYLEEATDL